MSTDHFPDDTKKVPAVGSLLDPGVGRLEPERAMTARARLLELLEKGGYAIQERGYGPFVLGSDGRTYAARTARTLEREKLAALSWNRCDGRFHWAWRATRKPPNVRAKRLP